MTTNGKDHTRDKRCVLVSGGMDSTILADQNPDAERLFIDYGQPYAQAERLAVQRLFGDQFSEIIVERCLQEHEQIYVPARNLMFATLAAMQGATEILIAGLADDNCDDKTPQAFIDMSRILTDQCGFGVVVHSPYFNLTKAELAMEYVESGGTLERLSSTYSCYVNNDGTHCKACPACFRLAVALECAGGSPFVPSDEVTKGYLHKLHEYGPRRQWATLTAARRWGGLVAVDIDGVLTEEVNGHDYENRTPRPSVSPMLSELSNATWIILHTSRPERDRAVTEQWLARHRISYDGLLMGKPPADVRVDDLSVPSLDAAMRGAP